MKEEKEILWIVNLFNESKLCNSKKGGSKKKFEEIANESYLDKKFRKWFKEMSEKGIINFLGYRENSKGSPTQIYILDKKKLVKYLKEFEFYKKFRNIIWDLKYGDI